MGAVAALRPSLELTKGSGNLFLIYCGTLRYFIAVAQSEGAERGLEEIHAIADVERMTSYPFYYAAVGELEHRCNRPDLAARHFRAALACARNPMEQRFLQQRLDACMTRVRSTHPHA